MCWTRCFGEIAACLAIGAVLSVAAGQDASWDLRNYHLYNAFSLLNNRFDQDFFPADKHSGFNPLLDLIYTALALGPLSHFPRGLAAVMGFWYGLLIFIIFRIVKTLFAPYTAQERRILVPVAVLTATTGAMTFSQIGTSSNDIAIAALVLTGLFFVLDSTHKAKHAWKDFALGGLIFGMAGGAKLTAVIYAPALVLALLFALPLRLSLRACASFVIAWLGGFFITFGWWGWLMWQRFANPVFPMMNGVFKSPLAPAINLNDARFFPHTFLQDIAYPFFWAWDKGNHLVYEFDFCDPRMAIAYGAIVLFAGLSLLNFYQKRQGKPTYPIVLSRPQKIALPFFVFSYFAWLITTSILRYAIALECLAIPLFVTIIMGSEGETRAKLKIVVIACLLCLFTARHSDWGHREFSATVVDVDTSWVQPNTLFLGVYEPFAYLAAAIPSDLHAQFAGLGFISYLHGWPLGYSAEHLVHNHQGPVFVLFREERRQYLNLLTPLGLSPDVKNCHMVISNLLPLQDPTLMACEVHPLFAF